MPSRSRRVAVLLAAAVLLAGCGSGSSEAPPEAAAGQADAASSAPADGSLDVHEAAADHAPPRDADLVAADWPATAAWIARAADQGEPVVVNFFASWCGPCRREAPMLEQARRDHPGVAFLGIAYRDFEEDSERFLRETGLEFATLTDFDGSVGAEMGVLGMPTTFFFDAEGRLVARHQGELSERTLADNLDRIIG